MNGFVLNHFFLGVLHFVSHSASWINQLQAVATIVEADFLQREGVGGVRGQCAGEYFGFAGSVTDGPFFQRDGSAGRVLQGDGFVAVIFSLWIGQSGVDVRNGLLWRNVGNLPGRFENHLGQAVVDVELPGHVSITAPGVVIILCDISGQ